jgi:hypothetical protein
MPKQGRRWTAWVCIKPGCGRLAPAFEDDPPALDGRATIECAQAGHPAAVRLKLMPTQEHVAALEGLAERLDGEAQEFILQPSVEATLRAVAKEVRNLIEQEAKP